MASRPTKARCRYCNHRHPPDYLCAAARQLLDAMWARGREFDAPAVEFGDPMPAEQLGLGGPGDQLLRQLVVQAAVNQVAGAPQPGLVFTGRGFDGRPLPRWLYLGSVEEIEQAVRLVQEVAGMAIRRVTDQQGPTG